MISTRLWSMPLAQVYHEISPPVDYSLTPWWVVFTISFVVLSIIGAVIWWIISKAQAEAPPKLPRQRALEALDQIGEDVERINPYEFSIRLSDILRGFVTEQYGLPLTRKRQLSFSSNLRGNQQFSGDEKSLLQDFLNRCDLIKFARYHATSADSRMLLERSHPVRERRRTCRCFLIGPFRVHFARPWLLLLAAARSDHRLLEGPERCCCGGNLFVYAFAR